MTAYIEAMRRYVTFSGRSTRSEFWYFHLVVLALALGGLIIDVIIAGPREPQPLVSAVIVIGHYLPSLAIIVRRLHDLDKSGWLALTCLIPVIGIIAFIVIGSTPSKPHRQEAAASTSGDDQPTRQVSSSSAAQQIERIEKLAALRASGRSPTMSSRRSRLTSSEAFKRHRNRREAHMLPTAKRKKYR